MRLAITGGGTGGHVYPALELARSARERGWEVRYYGSLRGQEGHVCRREGIDFAGYPVGPVPSMRTPRGWWAMGKILRASGAITRDFERWQPDVLLATGGYSSSAPLQAAAKLGLPFLIQEQNTVPGRTNLLFGPKAHAVATVFRNAECHWKRARVVRCGMPIRREIRESDQGRLRFGHTPEGSAPVVLVMGGSQGSAAVNEAALATAVRMANVEVRWLHVTGPDKYEATMTTLRRLAVTHDYEVRAFLDAHEMAAALFSATVVLSRSGSSLAEIAAYRKPSVLVPLPTAFADHQTHNAREFVEMGAALMLDQRTMTPMDVEGRLLTWLYDEPLREHAAAALGEWDVPDAVDRILGLAEEAAAT